MDAIVGFVWRCLKFGVEMCCASEGCGSVAALRKKLRLRGGFLIDQVCQSRSQFTAYNSLTYMDPSKKDGTNHKATNYVVSDLEVSIGDVLTGMNSLGLRISASAFVLLASPAPSLLPHCFQLLLLADAKSPLT